MSGRSRYRKSHHPLLGRIGKPRTTRAPSTAPMEWRLWFLAPADLLLAPGPTGVVGVTVTAPGPQVEARGSNRDWVLQQVANFLGRVAKDREFKAQATLERLDWPASSEAPGGGHYKTTRELVYVPVPSAVFLHPLKGALIFPVKDRAA